MNESSTVRIPRWRLVVFWLLMVVLLFLHLGERPEQLGFVITAFGDVGELATHEIHLFAQGVFAWVTVAAVAVNLRRPTGRVGAAWTYGLGAVLAFSLVLALADLPPEVVPILGAAIVVAVLGFLAHPSGLRDKFRSMQPPSPALFGLLAVAVIPLAVYATGQLRIHLGSGPGDEHYTFGHWVVMAVYALLPIALGAIAALKVAGWRFPLWAAGIMVAALGIASLGIDAVSQWRPLWAVAGIVWGAAFVAVGEVEARRAGMPARGDAGAPDIAPTAP